MTDTKAAPRPWRIKATDDLGNVSYVYKDGGRVRCALSNGISASLFYAGVHHDEMAVTFALTDARTARQAVTILESHGSWRYLYAALAAR